MSVGEPAQFPRLATPADLPRLISGDGVHDVWPPSGTTVLRIAAPEPWVVVLGEPVGGSEGDWWTTTLGELVLGHDDWTEQLLLRFSSIFTGPIASFASVVGHWPVIFEQGQSEGTFMRWLKTTVRGTLGGVEEFQFGVNLGNPGSDPDIDETEAMAMAERLCTYFGSAFVAAQSGVGTTTVWSPEVVFTEIGVTQCTQTDATSSDGTGGNLEQDFATQYFAWTTGTRPTGASDYPALPYEVACAVSLHTDHRGPSGRGRLYLPAPSTAQVEAGGKFTVGAVNVMGDLIKRYFDSIRAGEDVTPVVVSRRRIILNDVTQITCGKIPDSQRRRRRNQDEAPVVIWTAP